MSELQPPSIGDDPWGDALNEYLASLEERIAALEARPDYTYSYAPWTFNNNAPPASANQVRLNNVVFADVTIIDIRRIDSDDNDRSPWLRALDDVSFVRLSDWDNAAAYHLYRVTGAVTIGATNAQIPVDWVEGAGSIPNAKAEVAFLVDVSSMHPG